MELRKALILYLSALTLFASGCVYNNEEELYPINLCDTSNITYTDDVIPILADNCYQCHGTGIGNGGVVIDTYSDLKTYIDNGRLIGAIKHEPGFSPMPQGNPKLSDCSIEKIEKWISDGALNN